MIALLICNVCDARLELSDPEVVVAAEVATFAEAHGEHDRYAFTLRVVDRTHHAISMRVTYVPGCARVDRRQFDNLDNMR